MLNRQAIIDAHDLPSVEVAVPEWSGSVRVRTLTAAERMGLYVAAQAGGSFDMKVFQPLLVAMATIGDDGQRLFADDEVAIIASKSASAVQRIFEAASELNALGAKAVEDAAKNSQPTLSDASS